MAEFTKEQLIAAACSRIDFAKQMLRGNPSGLTRRNWEIELSLSEIALAALTAEPDYIRYTCGTCGYDSLSHLHECPECHSRHIHTDALCLMPLLEGLK